jgi:hypothetical protein
MISSITFMRQSLELHLFFARIMKEHSFFLEMGFTPKDTSFTMQADAFRKNFDRLLGEAISLSNGIANSSVLQSGEIVTPYTLKAEMASSYFTGIQIPTELTQAEIRLVSEESIMIVNPTLEQRIVALNHRSMSLIAALIQFKTAILSKVLSCKMFTSSYPLLIDHILREAKLYLRMVQRIQNREDINIQREAFEQELFWGRIMAEHSKFIRGLLDPTEEELINMANDFGNEFDKLTAETKAAMDMSTSLAKVTKNNLTATQRIRNFKEQGTQGILNCKVKSIIIPLLGDHVLREANHFLRLLRSYEKAI